MSVNHVVGALVVGVLLALGCSEDPLSGRVQALEQRVNELEISVQEQREGLLERLESIEVNPENAEEIADLRQKLHKPQMTLEDIEQLEARIVRLEGIYVDWSRVNGKFSYAVYAVLWALPLPNDDLEVSFIGTAFAVDDTRVLTNAHVVEALVYLDMDLEAFNEKYGTDLVSDWVVVRNKTTRLYYKSNYYFIMWYNTHGDWDPSDVSSPDVGYLEIAEGRLHQKVTLASNSEAFRLREGQRIATLGFPGELQGGILDNLSPIATFKDGTISALRPASSLITPSIYSNYIVQHNLDLSGGTSGSPIYDASGKVIAVNNAGIEGLVLSIGGTPTRISQAALGFGIRVDKVHEFLSSVAKQAPRVQRDRGDRMEELEGRDIRTLRWSNPGQHKRQHSE